MSCDQDLNSDPDQPTVDYVVVVADSGTAEPLGNVRIRVTAVTGDTASYLTDTVEGRVQLPTLASSRTLFELSRPGYVSRDTVDTVNAKPDSVFHRPVARLLRIHMLKAGQTAAERIQLYVLPRGPGLEKLKQATIAYEDSAGDLRTVADTAGSGSVGLGGLKAGKTLLLVQQQGYLGHWFESPEIDTGNSAGAPALVASLMPLGANSISGQVFYATGTGIKPLLGGRVEFRLRDSLAVPGIFTAFTSSDSLQFGRFKIENVPALDGQILYFKDRASTEPTKLVGVAKEDVLLEGPLASVTLTLADSTSPYLVQGPGDSIRPRDSLLFRFSQRVAGVESYSVSLINQSGLLADTAWNAEHTQLRLWQRDGLWIRGKTYRYALSLRNGAGQYFTAQGDTQRVIARDFSVADSAATDSAVVDKEPSTADSAIRIRVDLDGVPYRGKPIWQGNRNTGFLLP